MTYLENALTLVNDSIESLFVRNKYKINIIIERVLKYRLTVVN